MNLFITQMIYTFPQINAKMLFSATRREVPVIAKPTDMAIIKKYVIVANIEFFPEVNVNKLTKKGLNYIISMRMDSPLIPKPDHFNGVFMYEGKPLRYWKRENDVYMFEDPVLKSEEEKDFLVRIGENKRNRKQYDENEINFGKLYLLSDLKDEPERIYRLYKQREYVEYAFNVYKNDLEADIVHGEDNT